MVERALIGGLLATLTGLGTFGAARAEDARQPSPPSVILTLPARPIESSEKAMTEAIKEGALAWKIHERTVITATSVSMGCRRTCGETNRSTRRPMAPRIAWWPSDVRDGSGGRALSEGSALLVGRERSGGDRKSVV